MFYSTALIIVTCSSFINDVAGFGGIIPAAPSSPQQSLSFLTSSSSSSSPSSTTLYMAGRRGRPKGPLRTVEIKPTMNGQITQATLRVTTPSATGNGKDEPLGVMTRAEALAKAKEMGNLDLILINEHSDPPVCKIVDYSKYRYMKEKKAKELKKNAKATEVKEVKMSYKIGQHDYDVRVKSASKFISQGNRVKCTVMFKGREIQHDKLGVELLNKLAGDLDKVCNMEGKPKREGRTLFCFIMPKPEVIKAINDKKRAEEKKLRREREQSKQVMLDDEAKKKSEEEEAKKQKMEAETKAAASLDALLGAQDMDDTDASLDELLGGDDLTDDLFG